MAIVQRLVWRNPKGLPDCPCNDSFGLGREIHANANDGLGQRRVGITLGTLGVVIDAMLSAALLDQETGDEAPLPAAEPLLEFSF